MKTSTWTRSEGLLSIIICLHRKDVAHEGAGAIEQDLAIGVRELRHDRVGEVEADLLEAALPIVQDLHHVAALLGEVGSPLVAENRTASPAMAGESTRQGLELPLAALPIPVLLPSHVKLGLLQQRDSRLHDELMARLPPLLSTSSSIGSRRADTLLLLGGVLPQARARIRSRESDTATSSSHTCWHPWHCRRI